MYELKKIGKVLTKKSILTGPLSYEKIIYRAAVSQRLRDTGLRYRFATALLLSESSCGNGCLLCALCVTDRSLVHKSPTDCGAYLCVI